MNSTTLPPLGFQRVKVVALAVNDFARASRFYSETLGLPPAYEGEEQAGYLLGRTIFMLKSPWYAPPTEQPNPRITIAVEDARQTQRALEARGVGVADAVALFDDFYVGSFLDSEGNKL